VNGQQSSVSNLEYRKNQYGPISDSVTMEWDSQFRLFLPTGSGKYDAAVKRQIARDVFLALLLRFTLENRKVSHVSGGNYGPNLFCTEKEATETFCSKQELAQAMRDLIAEKIIFVEESGKPSHRTSRLRIKPQAAEQDAMAF
jgi:hypothetical protein